MKRVATKKFHSVDDVSLFHNYYCIPIYFFMHLKEFILASLKAFICQLSQALKQIYWSHTISHLLEIHLCI